MDGRLAAAILAGGRSSRMGGGDKSLLRLGDVRLIDHMLAALRPQAEPILINSNGDAAIFAGTGCAVRTDAVPGRLGPLAGILTAMLWARELGRPFVLTVPCDTPFLPHDLAARLIAAQRADAPVVAESAGRLHPTVGLWPVRSAEPLRAELDAGMRKVRAWLDQTDFAVASFALPGGQDPFRNVNTPADLLACATDLPARDMGRDQ